jgi:hypothetical protein
MNVLNLHALYCFIPFLFYSTHKIFQKSNSDAFEALVDDIGDVGDAEITPSSSGGSPRHRSSSQGSLYSLDDLSNDKENNLRGGSKDSTSAARQDNKNRLSFKLVRQMKVPNIQS